MRYYMQYTLYISLDSSSVTLLIIYFYNCMYILCVYVCDVCLWAGAYVYVCVCVCVCDTKGVNVIVLIINWAEVSRMAEVFPYCTSTDTLCFRTW